MNILLIGSGGREHALARALAQSPSCDRLFAAPGNPGIALWAERVSLDVADAESVRAFCAGNAISLVVIGPEQPLVDGLADRLRQGGIAVFGPDAAAARLEGSKGFTKDLCAEFAIPTARFRRHQAIDTAVAGLDEFGWPAVIKADGLAAGKGVVIATNRNEGEAALTDMFSGRYGNQNSGVVIEECLTGPEASLFVLSDGREARLFATAQDHKRVGDGDTGPNTGGMGAISPAPLLSDMLVERAMAEIVRPTLAAMAARGTPFVGVLYAGLMLTSQGPKLIEYNVRFGDPEAQAIFPRFRGDLAQLFLAVARGQLNEYDAPDVARDYTPLDFTDESAVTVVIAARGYPEAPISGGVISGIERAEAAGTMVFQAGTTEDSDTAQPALRACGGRVLAVTGLGPDPATARAHAYAGVAAIAFSDGFYRTDIAAGL